MNIIYIRLRLTTLACLSTLGVAACGASATGSGSQDSALEGEPDSPNPPGDSASSGDGVGQPGGEIGQPAACSQAFTHDTPGKQCNVTHGGLCFETNEVACACAGCPMDANGATCLIAESFPAQAFCERPTPPSGPSDVDPDCAVSDGDPASDAASEHCGGADTPPSGTASPPNGGGSNGSVGSDVSCASGFAAGSAKTVCNATFGGMCFESDADACACAGCPIDSPAGCVVAESYPTQISCR